MHKGQAAEILHDSCDAMMEVQRRCFWHLRDETEWTHKNLPDFLVAAASHRFAQEQSICPEWLPGNPFGRFAGIETCPVGILAFFGCERIRLALTRARLRELRSITRRSCPNLSEIGFSLA